MALCITTEFIYSINPLLKASVCSNMHRIHSRRYQSTATYECDPVFLQVASKANFTKCCTTTTNARNQHYSTKHGTGMTKDITKSELNV